MAIRSEVQQLIALGPFPASADAEEHDIDRRGALLTSIKPPLTHAEAAALLICFGPDEAFGLAWALLHLIESTPGGVPIADRGDRTGVDHGTAKAIGSAVAGRFSAIASNDAIAVGDTIFTVASLLTGSEAALAKAGGLPNIVYRGLAAGENASVGLVARAPGVGNSVASHVAGKRHSQWISTTRNEAIARDVFGQHGYVKIDLSRVTGEIVDLTRGIPGMTNGMLSNWAKKFEEVLVRDSIPPDAIIR